MTQRRITVTNLPERGNFDMLEVFVEAAVMFRRMGKREGWIMVKEERTRKLYRADWVITDLSEAGCLT